MLKRLQELKNWQAEQEERLLREQEDQMDHLYTAAVNRNHVVVKAAVDNDDASTIDQDISSLADDNELEEVLTARFSPFQSISGLFFAHFSALSPTQSLRIV